MGAAAPQRCDAVGRAARRAAHDAAIAALDMPAPPGEDLSARRFTAQHAAWRRWP